MHFKHLDWDTNFFNRKIGRIDVALHDTIDEIDALILEKRKEDYSLIYLFQPYGYEMQESSLYKLVDQKVIYEIDLIEPNLLAAETNNVVPFDGKITKELYELAYTSGQFSRFKLDENFHSDDFYNLYNKWIEKAVKQNEAFVYEENGIIEGFVTLSIDSNEGVIGLIAVNSRLQGKGVGKSLMNFVYKSLLDKNVHVLSVATQRDNHQACKFYEACGMHVRVINNIYHCWL